MNDGEKTNENKYNKIQTINENEIDELNIIYDFNKSREIDIPQEDIELFKEEMGETISKEKIFGERFVKNNKKICKIIINGKEEEICSYLLNYKNYIIKDKLEIKLRGIKNIIDSSFMFSGCLSLSSLPNISKWNVKNIINMRYMFFFCLSLKYLDDISKWKINNVKDMLGIFQFC